MKHSYLILILIIAFLLPSKDGAASHVMGGDIGYTYIGGDSFRVTLKLYRDCSGINAPATASVKIQSTCFNLFVTLPMDTLSSGIEITPVCTLVTNTPCNPMSIPPLSVPVGVEEFIYESVVIFPAGLTCQKFTFFYTTCCRNAAITNININSAITLVSELDRSIFPGNSSPIFTEAAPIYGIAGHVNYFDFSAVDPDGDSLVYKLIAPHDNNPTTPVSYTPGFNYLQPFLVQTPMSFDSTTGIITVIPNGAQVAVVGVRVEKYRAGNMVGYVDKDFQIIIMLGAPNTSPVLTGIDSTSNLEFIAYPGDTISFEVYGNSMNQLAPLALSWNAAIPGASFTVSGTSTAPVGHFYWIVDASHMQFHPYIFKVNGVREDCPVVTKVSKFFKIYVLNPGISDVWPGDADNNLVADVYDLLPIGIAYGSTGLVRANASSNWVAQPSPNWSQQFMNTLNYKFADANGDGVVDSLDINVVSLNYGMTHPKTTVPAVNTTGDLYLDIIGDTLSAGQTVMADIFLGTQNKPAGDVYGMAFKINFDASLIEMGSVEFVPDSWLGSVSNQSLIHLSKEFNGSIEVALSRTDQTNMTGHGKIGTMQFKIRDDINTTVPFQDLSFGFSGVKAISANENEIPFTSGTSTVVVQSNPTGIIDHTSIFVNIFPNPAKDVLTVEIEAGKFNELTFFDIQGKLIFETNIEKGKATISVKDIPAGVYVLTLKGEAGSLSKKVIVE